MCEIFNNVETFKQKYSHEKKEDSERPKLTLKLQSDATLIRVQCDYVIVAKKEAFLNLLKEKFSHPRLIHIFCTNNSTKYVSLTYLVSFFCHTIVTLLNS